MSSGIRPLAFSVRSGWQPSQMAPASEIRRMCIYRYQCIQFPSSEQLAQVAAESAMVNKCQLEMKGSRLDAGI